MELKQRELSHPLSAGMELKQESSHSQLAQNGMGLRLQESSHSHSAQTSMEPKEQELSHSHSIDLKGQELSSSPKAPSIIPNQPNVEAGLEVKHPEPRSSIPFQAKSMAAGIELMPAVAPGNDVETVTEDKDTTQESSGVLEGEESHSHQADSKQTGHERDLGAGMDSEELSKDQGMEVEGGVMAMETDDALECVDVNVKAAAPSVVESSASASIPALQSGGVAEGTNLGGIGVPAPVEIPKRKVGKVRMYICT